jgi:hypothetical protein
MILNWVYLGVVMTRRKFYFLLVIFFYTTLITQAQQPYLVETFDDNHQGWPFLGAASDQNIIQLENGHLGMDGRSTAIQTFKKVNELNAELDYTIYARFIFINGTSEGWMGIRFNMNEEANKYYSFVYNNAKGFLISTSNGKKYEVLRESKSAVVVAYDYNTLTIIKTGTTYKFLINDKQVHEAKIKDHFGPLIGVMTNQNMKMLVDEVQVYDPKKGKVKTNVSSLIQAPPAGGDIKSIVQTMTTKLPADYQEFYDSFQKFVYPYDYSTVSPQSHDVSSLSFVQKHFFAYDLSQISNHTVWAVAHLANCKDGYAFLVANQYTINNQDITQFRVEAFDKTGASMGSKEIGSFVKERNGYFKTLDFKIRKEGNSIFIESVETFANGNKSRGSVGFNTELCNL